MAVQPGEVLQALIQGVLDGIEQGDPHSFTDQRRAVRFAYQRGVEVGVRFGDGDADRAAEIAGDMNRVALRHLRG